LKFARDESRRSERGSSVDLADRVAELLPGGAKILEIGGIDGEISLALARKERFKISLAYFSDEALAKAKRLFSERQVTAEFLDENDADGIKKRFDLVFNSGVIEHFELPEQAAFLSDLAARSRKYVLVVAPNRQCYWYWMWRNQKAARAEWIYGNEVPRVDLSVAFESAGLTFLGQTYLGVADTENYINDLEGIDRPVRDLAIATHRSGIIPLSQSAAWIAALGTVESQPIKVPRCWRSPELIEAGAISTLTAALSDALSSRVCIESKFQHLEKQFGECHEKLTNSEQEFSKMEIQAKLLYEKLMDLEASHTWRIALKMQAVRKIILPPESRRAKMLKKCVGAPIAVFRALRHPPVRSMLAYGLAMTKRLTPSPVARLMERPRRIVANLLPDRVREYLRSARHLAENIRSPLMERLDQFLDAEATNNPTGKIFVFFSGTTFTESEGQRPTRLARELARRGVPVIFCYWRWKATEPPQVTSFPHVFCLPIDELLRDFEDLMSDSRLAELQRTFMMEFPHPSLLEVVNYANAFGWKTVFDIIDDWEEFHQCGQAVWYDRDVETYLIRNSDLVSITAEKLLWKLAGDEPQRCHLLPNAFEDWTAPRKAVETPKGGGRITIGYFGHLTASWFDWPLVVEAAKKHPDWTFQIIGYGLDKKIESLPNIVHLGKIEHSQLPAYAANWDAAMIPFKPSRLSEAVDPIKIYEYVALGLRTVVTGMMHLDTYPGVFTAETPREFEEAVEKAAASRMSEAEVAEFLGRNRWSNRIDTLMELLERPESSSIASLALAKEDWMSFEEQP
jgi:hypothetical protein